MHPFHSGRDGIHDNGDKDLVGAYYDYANSHQSDCFVMEMQAIVEHVGCMYQNRGYTYDTQKGYIVSDSSPQRSSQELF